MKLTQIVGTRWVLTSGLLVTSGALLVLSTTTIEDGYTRLAMILAVLGAGMGFILSPATHAVMSALPPEKAGVGSAVNDSVGQVGGALGVAVLGSVLSSVYGGLPSESTAFPCPRRLRTVSAQRFESRPLGMARRPRSWSSLARTPSSMR